MVAGTGRLLEALPQFRFDDAACRVAGGSSSTRDTLGYLREFRFGGDIDGYAEGELYFPGSPVLSVRGSFAECVVLETLALSIFNHDTAIASAAARMVSAAERTPTDRDGIAAHPRARRGRSGPGRLYRRLRRVVQPGGPAPLRSTRRGHRRARLHHAAHHGPTVPDELGRVPCPGRRAGRWHHAAGRHL